MINSVCEKFCFSMNGLSKMLFFIFSFFNFSKLQMTNVKNLFLKPSFFKIDFDGSYEVLLRHKYF